MNVRQILLIIVICWSLPSYGQIYYLGAYPAKTKMLERLALSTSGKTRVDLLNRLAHYIVVADGEQSVKKARQALAFAKAVDYPEGKGAAYLNIGNYYYYKDDKMKALAYYYAALPLLEPQGPSKNLGVLYYYLGMLDSYMMKYDKMIPYLQRSLSNVRAVHDSEAIIQLHHYFWCAYTGRSTLCENIRIPLEQDSEFLRTDIQMNYFRRHPDSDPGGWNMIYCTNRKALMYLERKDTQALTYALRSLELSEKNGSSWAILGAYEDLGEIYQKVFRNDKKALECYLKALKIYPDLKGTYEEGSRTCILASDVYIRKREFGKALALMFRSHEYLVQTLKNTDKIDETTHAKLFLISKMNASKVEVDSVLSLIYRKTGEYKKSMFFLQEYYQSLNTLLLDQTNLRVSMMQGDMEVNEAKHKAELFAQESRFKAAQLNRTRIASIGGGLIVIISTLLMVSYFRRKKLVSEQRSMVLEQKLLRSQMNPHFIFNSLASIQNFIVNEKPSLASDYLGRFSRLIRNILDNSVEEQVPLEKEIDTIRNYLELQKVRYTGKFEYRITLDPSLDPENIFIPPMLAQPFIENSIEHGIKHKESQGIIDIRFNRDHDLIRFEVEDDGVGREKAREIEITQNGKHRPMATSITRDRLRVINKRLKAKIQLEITDMKNAVGDGCGTRVSFAIPVKMK